MRDRGINNTRLAVLRRLADEGKTDDDDGRQLQFVEIGFAVLEHEGEVAHLIVAKLAARRLPTDGLGEARFGENEQEEETENDF